MHKKSFLENVADSARRNVLATTLAAGALLGTLAPAFGQQRQDKLPNAANNEIHTVTHPGVEGRIRADTVINDLAFYYLERGATPEEDNTYWGVIVDRSEEEDKHKKDDKHNVSYFVKMSKDYAAYRQKIKTGKNIPSDPLKALPFAAEELEARSKIYDAIHNNRSRRSVNEFDRAHAFTDPSYGWFLYGNQTRSNVATMQGNGMTIGGEVSIPVFRSNEVEQHTYIRAFSTFYFDNPDQFNVKFRYNSRYRQGTSRYTRIPGEVSLELGARTKPTSPLIAEAGIGARHYWGSRVNTLNRADFYGAGRLGVRFPAKGPLQFEAAAKLQYTHYSDNWLKYFERDAQDGWSLNIHAGLVFRPGLLIGHAKKKLDSKPRKETKQEKSNGDDIWNNMMKKTSLNLDPVKIMPQADQDAAKAYAAFVDNLNNEISDKTETANALRYTL